jgi:hypothetical protein
MLLAREQLGTYDAADSLELAITADYFTVSSFRISVFAADSSLVSCLLFFAFSRADFKAKKVFFGLLR